MAAPVAALWIAGIFATLVQTLWQGLTILVKWMIEHAHIVKVVTVCLLVIAAFYTGHRLYLFFMSTMGDIITQMNSSSPNGAQGSIELLAKVNYCIPVSEMLALLSIYATLGGYCIAFKFLISLWRSTPFKAT